MNAQSPPPLPTEQLWYYATADGSAEGPVTLSEIHALARQGIITAESYVIRQEAATWTTYGEIARNPTSRPPLVPERPEETVHHRRWPAVVFTLLFPFGLIALWLSKGYTTTQKLLIAGYSLVVVVAAIRLEQPSLMILIPACNALFFTWWGEKLAVVWKSVLSIIVAILLFPPVIVGLSHPSAYHPELPAPTVLLTNATTAPTSTSSESLEVRIEPTTAMVNGKLIVSGATNLPDNARLTITASGTVAGMSVMESDYATVSGGYFKGDGILLGQDQFPAGHYTLDVWLPISPAQSDSIEAQLGPKRSRMTGSLVVDTETGKFVRYTTAINVGGESAEQNLIAAKERASTYFTEFRTLYDELVSFKATDDFLQKGFSPAGKQYREWKARVQALSTQPAPSQYAKDLPAFLSLLADQYLRSGGSETDNIAATKRLIAERQPSHN